MEYFKAVQSASKHRRELLEFQHFEVDQAIKEFAHEVMHAELEALSGCPELIEGLGLPSDVRLPASKCTFNLGADGGFVVAFQDGTSIVMLAMNDLGDCAPMAVLQPKKRPIIDDRSANFSAGFNDEAEIGALWFGYLLSLINQPRIVASSAGLSRQQARAAHRGFGFAVDAWTRVSWDLSKETRLKLERDPSFHPMPLHFRRAHWRRAEQHYKGAVQRPDALRIEDRALWWQWIEETWPGHPAYGFKKSVHAPKMSLGRLAKRRAA